MAIRALSINRADKGAAGTKTIGWAGLLDDDTGAPLESNKLSDKTIQCFGAFGATGSLTMQGSNDPRVETDPDNAVWFTLVDPQANEIVKTEAFGEVVLENPTWIRPFVNAGDGDTNLTVIISAKG